jgi:hypothetical protein
MQRAPSKTAKAFFVGAALLSGVARADFIPIPLTSGSFNQDVVVEKSAPSPVQRVTTASMDGGMANTNFSWYERGYNLGLSYTGFPVAGSTITSESLAGHDYRLAPDYKSNNAVMIDSTLTSGTLTLGTPAAYTQLSFLTAAGSGPGTIQFTIHYQNGTTQTGTFTCPDWLSTASAAHTSFGRIDVRAFIFDSLNEHRPSLFTRDISLSDTNNPVTQIDLGYVSGAAHNAVFAVSGSASQTDPFTPIAVSGFNIDLVVESTAPRREALITATTASMESGTQNANRTWYERGYYPPDPATGFPPPGSILTNSLAPDHRYALAASYTANNALMLDLILTAGSLTPANPAAYAALSFLCAAGHGTVTNECVINHDNGSSQTNTLIIPDWFDGPAPVFVSNGALDLGTRIVDSTTTNPRLYAIDVPLANTISTVTNVVVTFKGGPPNSHSAIFAISGLPSQTSGPRPVLTISQRPGGSLQITSTQLGQLQSTTALDGANTIWQAEGLISGTMTITPTSGISRKFYRVLAQ